MKELPVELWREIFERAIDDSQLQDPLYDYRPRSKWFRDPPSSYRRYSHPLIMNTAPRLHDVSDHCGDGDLRTKLAIVSTSSQWRKIGLPYLFRTVSFTTLRQLELITSLVRGSRYRYVDGPHNIRLLLEGKGTGYGAMIKRIESSIYLRNDKSDHSMYADMVSDLLKCCPNLRIYVNRNSQPGTPTPSRIVNALSDIGVLPTEPCCETTAVVVDVQPYCPIERLEWSGKEGLVVGDLTFLLRSTPFLRKLILGPIFLCSTRLSDTLSDPLIPLHCLQSLHIDFTSLHRAYIRYTRRWLMPNLRHLQVVIASAPWQTDLLFLLDAVGESLRSLHLRVLQHTSMLTSDWVDILLRCPNLHFLVFNASAMPVIPPQLALPNLKIVGLEGCLPDFRATNEYDRPESDRREQLTEHLGSLEARNGTVESVRMMDDEFLLMSGPNAERFGTMGWEVPRSKKLTRELSTWKDWYTTLKAVGITLANRDGDTIGEFK